MEKIQQLRIDRRIAAAKARRELALGNLANAIQAQREAHELTTAIANEAAEEFARNSRMSLLITAQTYRDHRDAERAGMSIDEFARAVNTPMATAGADDDDGKI